jgi:tetratricopeptide (TPR) repeat protein
MAAVTAAYPSYFAGDYDRTIEKLRRFVDLAPDFYPAHTNLAGAYRQKGKFDLALAEFDAALRLEDTAEVRIALAQTLAVAGRRGEARRILMDLKSQPTVSFISPFNLATVHVALGDNEKGLALLERAYASHSEDLTFVKVDPRLAPLRSEPRFHALLLRMRLAP